MRFQTVLLSLLAASVAAYPQLKRATLLPREEKCELPRNGSPDETRNTWEKAGVNAYLNDFLDKGVEDWQTRFFEENKVSGDDKGTTRDCARLNGDSCGPTKDCGQYNKPEAYMVHAAMINVNYALTSIHEKLQDNGIWQLSKSIKDIEDIFGPPPETADFMAELVGAFVLGSAGVAKMPQFSGPLTAVVGILNVANGLMEKKEPDYEGELEKTYGDIFKAYKESVDKAVDKIFTGDFSDDEAPEGGKKFIINSLGNGNFLNSKDFDDMVEEWKKGVEKSINRLLIFKAMKQNDYYLRVIVDEDEEWCDDSYGKKGVYTDDACFVFVKNEKVQYGDRGRTRTHGREMPDEMFDALTEDYKIDYKDAIKNARDCEGTNIFDIALMGVNQALGEIPDWPQCVVNLEVKKCNKKSKSSGASSVCL